MVGRFYYELHFKDTKNNNIESWVCASTVPSISHVLSLLILKTHSYDIGNIYDPHFRDEETEANQG